MPYQTVKLKGRLSFIIEHGLESSTNRTNDNPLVMGLIGRFHLLPPIYWDLDPSLLHFLLHNRGMFCESYPTCETTLLQLFPMTPLAPATAPVITIKSVHRHLQILPQKLAIEFLSQQLHLQAHPKNSQLLALHWEVRRKKRTKKWFQPKEIFSCVIRSTPHLHKFTAFSF